MIIEEVVEAHLRHKMFISSKSVQVIINRGGCENVVVALTTEAELTSEYSYKLQWIRRGNKVKALNICLVQF